MQFIGAFDTLFSLYYVLLLLAIRQYIRQYIKGICLQTMNDLHVPSILRVHILRVRSESFLEHSRIVALLKHEQIHASLVLEPNPLCVRVCVERVHQH